MSDSKPFTARMGWSPRFRNRFGFRNIKMIGEVASAAEEALPHSTFSAELKQLIWVRYYPRIQTPSGGLATCALRIRRDHCIDFLEKGS